MSRTSAFPIILALSLVVSAAPVCAQVSLDVAKITCDQYVHSKITVPNYIAIWISGYYNAKRGNHLIDVQNLQANVTKLENFCYQEKNFKMPVLEAVEKLFGSSN
jgi:hypothetical protein